MAVITTTTDIDELKDLVSDYWYAKVVADTTGADLSPADTFGPGPLRESFDINPNITENTKETESGVESVTSLKEKWELAIKTGQVGIKVLNDLPNAITNKLLLIVLELNQEPIGGEHVYAALIGKLKGRPQITNKVSPEFKFQVYKATDDIIVALDATTFPNFAGDISTPVNLTISSGQYIGMVAVAAA